MMRTLDELNSVCVGDMTDDELGLFIAEADGKPDDSEDAVMGMLCSLMLAERSGTLEEWARNAAESGAAVAE